MHSFEVHSNESACRKSGRLGLEQVIDNRCINEGLYGEEAKGNNQWKKRENGNGLE